MLPDSKLWILIKFLQVNIWLKTNIVTSNISVFHYSVWWLWLSIRLTEELYIRNDLCIWEVYSLFHNDRPCHSSDGLSLASHLGGLGSLSGCPFGYFGQTVWWCGMFFLEHINFILPVIPILHALLLQGVNAVQPFEACVLQGWVVADSSNFQNENSKWMKLSTWVCLICARVFCL